VTLKLTETAVGAQSGLQVGGKRLCATTYRTQLKFPAYSVHWRGRLHMGADLRMRWLVNVETNYFNTVQPV